MRFGTGAATALLLAGLAPFGAVHANAIGASTGSVAGGLRLYGLGDALAGDVTDAADGRGNVAFEGGYLTCTTTGTTRACTVTGSYVDSAGSDGTPGGGGTFSLVTSWDTNYGGPTYGLPAGAPPLWAKQGAGPVTTDPLAPYNTVTFTVADESIYSVLTLSPSGGGPQLFARAGGATRNGPFYNEFTYFYRLFSNGPQQASCTGLSPGAVCQIGDVSLTSGARIFGAINTVNFDIRTVNRASVPEPPAFALLALGLLGAAVTRRRRLS